jgi:hypothetical protein
MKSGIGQLRSLLLIIFVFTRFTCFSQIQLSPGYIVNNQGDTVPGKGMIGKNHRFIWFQQDGMQDLHKFYPGEVRCIRFLSGKYYVPKEITFNEVDYKLFKENIINGKTETFFFEYLLDGVVDIFMFNFNGYHKYYIEKSGMPLQELPFYEYTMKVDGKYYKVDNPVFREFMKVYMQDSPETCEEIDHVNKLDPPTLIKLSEEYHYKVCKNYDCINYTKKLFGHKSHT